MGYPSAMENGMPIGRQLEVTLPGINIDTGEMLLISMEHPAVIGAVFDYDTSSWVVSSNSDRR